MGAVRPVKLYLFISLCLSVHRSFDSAFPVFLDCKCGIGRNHRACGNGLLKGASVGSFCVTTRLCSRGCIYSHQPDASGRDRSVNNHCEGILERPLILKVLEQRQC